MAERRLQERMIDRYLDTVWCIASSRYVQHFVIGYTSQSGKERFNGYLQRGYDNLVVLADRLTKRQALQLEEQLQSACKAGGAYGEPYRRKYHPDHRNLHYIGSAGQGSPDPTAQIHSVYMAWKQP